MGRFFDLHHHILYGLDDGPGTYDEMTSMLRMAATDGIGTIIATPHVSPGLKPIDSLLIQKRILQANAYCLDNGLDLRIHRGAEVLFTPALANVITQRRVPTLMTTRYVLLEFHLNANCREIEGGIHLLINGGYIPILAHVERYQYLMGNLRLLKQLKSECSVLYQMNCAALSGRFYTRRFAARLLKEQLIDFASTDAHNATTRSCNMKEFYQAAEDILGVESAESLSAKNAEICFFL